MMTFLLLIVLMPIMSMAWDLDSKTFEKLDASFLEKACVNTSKTVCVFDPEKSSQETFIEMSRFLTTNSSSRTCFGFVYAKELFSVQLILSNLVERLEKVNADLVDFSMCPQFRIVFKCCDPPLSYIVFGDKTIVRVGPGGRMANTTTDISKMFSIHDYGCRTIQVDTVRQTFSMVWLDDVPLPNIVTMSPVLSYSMLPAKPIVEKVSTYARAIKKLVAHMQLNVPVGENEK